MKASLQQTERPASMYSRLFIVACCAAFLLTFDDRAEAQQTGACQGLAETECKAKAECFWKESKSKCKEKGDQGKTESTPPKTDEAPSEPPPQ
jgi:hypothetical protein